MVPSPTARFRLRLEPSTLLLIAIGVTGCVLRLLQFREGVSLWNDEQLLALNVARRGFSGLLAPLDHDQAAPVGFLMATRSMIRLFGVSEWSLRSVPLLSGLALSVVAVFLARRLLRTDVAPVGALLLALSPPLIQYADEFKPYALDATIAAVLLVVTLRVLDDPDRRNLLALGVAGVLAPLFSLAAMFLLPVIVAALALAFGPTRRVARIAAAFAAIDIVTYLVFVRPTSANPYLHAYMAAALPSLADFPRVVAGVGTQLLSALVLPPQFAAAGWPLASVILVPMCIAIAVLAREKRWPGLMLLGGPLVMALVVAATRTYPLVPRLQLFLVPSVTLLAAMGLDVVTRRLPRLTGHAACVFVGAVLLLTTARTVRYLATHRVPAEDPRTVVRAWRAAARPGDAVYVLNRGAPAWLFYTTDWRRPNIGRLDWYARMTSGDGVLFRNAVGRSRRVEREGDDYVMEHDGVAELVGLPSGMQITLRGMSQRDPDEGWADNEARRIHAAGDSVWVFVAHHIPYEVDELSASLRALGMKLELRWRSTNAVMYRAAVSPHQAGRGHRP